MQVNQFFIAGINYKKTDVSVRGQFTINEIQYHSILTKALLAGIKELFILSTCNRTEIYGMANSAEELIELLCSETLGDVNTFSQLCYCKQGMQAIEHLFNVAAGLDSQILGDYEIVGQIKQALKFSREHGFVSTYFERLTNTVLQSSKAIRTNTELSSGTVSVSFAAVQYIRNNIADIKNKKILLIGTGKIGRNTCKNLVDYLNTKNITIINRTEDKSLFLAEEMGLRNGSYENVYEEIEKSDIIIVATNAQQPIIATKDIDPLKRKLLIDLSIPNNIESSLKDFSNVTLLNVDDLSEINDNTLKRRLAEVPKVKKIIAEYIAEFIEWQRMRSHVPVLKAVKEKLNDIHDSHLRTQSTGHAREKIKEEAVQKVVSTMAVKMRQHHKPGCNYIEAINDFLESSGN